ncbi:MAG: hypothetical protein ACTSW4_02370 [Candidatus Ranarchaeia archaeon]
MGVIDKIGKVAEELAKSAHDAIANVIIGTHNVLRGLTGIVDMKKLEERRAKERAIRTVEYRGEKKFLRPSKYYFIDSIGKNEYGPEEIRGKPSKEKLEHYAKKYLVRCPECGRWVDRKYWVTAKARCQICVEEDKIIMARTARLDKEGKPILEEIPRQKILIEEKRVPEKCPQCGYPLHEKEIKWVGPDKYQCPSCGSESYVEKVHREIPS